MWRAERALAGESGPPCRQERNLCHLQGDSALGGFSLRRRGSRVTGKVESSAGKVIRCQGGAKKRAEAGGSDSRWRGQGDAPERRPRRLLRPRPGRVSPPAAPHGSSLGCWNRQGCRGTGPRRGIWRGFGEAREGPRDERDRRHKWRTELVRTVFARCQGTLATEGQHARCPDPTELRGHRAGAGGRRPQRCSPLADPPVQGSDRSVRTRRERSSTCPGP